MNTSLMRKPNTPRINSPSAVALAVSLSSVMGETGHIHCMPVEEGEWGGNCNNNNNNRPLISGFLHLM